MIKLAELIGKCNECGRDWNHGHDHEAGMAKNELRDMISNASKIDSMVGEGDDLPGWVSAYISLAADYMHSVAEYMAGETSRMEEPGPGYGAEGSRLNEGLDAKYTPDDVYKYAVKSKSIIGFQGREDILYFKSEQEAKQYVKQKPSMREYLGVGKMEEAKKPSAGLTKKQKSAVAKKARAGKDIGKKGPGFEKVAKAAEKKYGSKEAGEKVAAAAMWKNIKR